ncbi:MAG TPA: thermonuclease family protein, partial [Gemmatimonadales bacterium]|nr:thermonuclease family protein [Gemmatimonadales bacterium]
RLAPPGASVRLERDVAPRDRYGRELAHVWSGSRLVNEALVLEGWAMLYTVPPNVKYAERLERVQKQARAAGAGLWGSGGFACAPSAYRRGECR